MTSRRQPSLLALALLAAAGCGSSEPEAGAPGDGSTAGAPTGSLEAILDALPPSRFAAKERDLPRRGEPLPDLAGTTLSGEAVGKGHFEGKLTLLNLWFYG